MFDNHTSLSLASHLRRVSLAPFSVLIGCYHLSSVMQSGAGRARKMMNSLGVALSIGMLVV